MRFAQRRWSDAAALARDALRRDPRDEYALDVLGSSLFMQDDDVGALRAWNQIGKPRVNRVRIEGLHHTRYQTVAEVMAIQPNMLLTAEIFDRARRRLGELPDHAATRLAVKPEADGFATVDVVVVELAACRTAPWSGPAPRRARVANREIDVSVPGVSGQGEVVVGELALVEQSARRQRRLRRAARARPAGRLAIRGLVAVGHLRRRARRSRTVESRTHGGLTVSDWLSARVRYSVSTGLDAWSGGRKAASIGGALERVAFDDRLSLSIDATQWAPLTGGAAFRLGRRARDRAVVGGDARLGHARRRSASSASATRRRSRCGPAPAKVRCGRRCCARIRC